MLKKFYLIAILSFIIALAVSMTASYFIQTNETNRTTDAKLNLLLDDVAVLIAENDEQIKKIRTELDESYLEKTRLFAEMIRLNPEIINDVDELCRIRDIMNVDELHVVDGDGILRYGSVPGYFGYDMASAEQSGEFMAIIDDPSIEMVQDPQPNGAEGWLFQYAGVARSDAEGFVQIGMKPERLEKAMQEAAPENILKQIKIDKSMRILILSGSNVVGDSLNTLLGTDLGANAFNEGTGNMKLDAQVHYSARKLNDYLVVAIINGTDMYAARNSMLVIFFITNAMILFALVLVIGVWMSGTIIKPLLKVVGELNTIAEGNLNRRIKVSNTPEFAALSDGINAMVNSIGKMLGDAESMTETLRSVIGSVENGAKSVDLSSHEMFRESNSLADGARAQDQIVSDMAKLLEDIRGNADENVTNASHASEVSRTALQNADDGSVKMTEMVSAVKEIDKASQGISKVIKTIDDIAFQTNILALNAAVEAARAGAHGKGFAVVAEEVRNLAGKSAEAAKQTETLITSSIQRAQNGVAIADETAGKITEIVSNIKESALLMEDIVTSSQEQASAVAQLNEGMSNIRRSVEATIRSAESITAESEKLQLSSGEMSGVIRQINVRREQRKISDGADESES